MLLHHRDPARSMFRFYRVRVVADLWGDAQVLREWGRIGSPGLVRCDPQPSVEAAQAAAARLLRAKQRKGYHAPR